MSERYQRVPGPPGRFLIGDTYEYDQDRLAFLARAQRDYGDVFRFSPTAITVVGLLALLWVMRMDVTPWRLVPALVVAGLGSSLMMGPYFALSLSEVEPHEVGTATGVLSALQQGGSSVGAALLGTVFFEAGTHGDSVPLAASAAFAVAAGMAALMFLAGYLFPAYRPDPTP